VTYTAVDCQGFAGGFTLGAVQAGFKLVGKREMQGGFGVANCEANRHLLGDDWVSEAVVPEAWSVPSGGADLVFGNPPCSGFSVLSSKSFRGVESKINACMWAFSNYAAKVAPQIAIFESVPLAFTQGHSLMTALFESLREKCPDPNWKLYHVRHNAYALGGPAMRARYFWVAARIPFGIEIERPGKLPVFRDIIDDLATQDEGTWGPQAYTGTPTWYSSRFWSSTGTVDGHVAIDNPNTRRTRDILAELDWQPGEYAQKATRRFFEKHGKLPDSWGHLQSKLIERDFAQGYNTPTMWHPDKPARVVTGAGMLNGVHYSEKRTFTHREVARVMGFPDDWLIEPLQNVPGLFMTWGKGITVDCGRWIARWALRALEGNPGTHVGGLVAEDQYLIDVTNAWKPNCDTVTQSTRNILKKLTVLVSEEKIVTEAAVAPEATATEAPAEASTAKRGRPRPQDTKERDEKVFLAVAGSERRVTREEVAQGVGITGSEAYLSLYRLNKALRVERTREGGNHVWGVRASAEVA
jgi:site-specific DNA-cytosine methylase